MQHLFDILRLKKLTMVLVAMGGVVGEFRIDQRTTHDGQGSDGDREDVNICRQYVLEADVSVCVRS